MLINDPSSPLHSSVEDTYETQLPSYVDDTYAHPPFRHYSAVTGNPGPTQMEPHMSSSSGPDQLRLEPPKTSPPLLSSPLVPLSLLQRYHSRPRATSEDRSPPARPADIYPARSSSPGSSFQEAQGWNPPARPALRRSADSSTACHPLPVGPRLRLQLQASPIIDPVLLPEPCTPTPTPVRPLLLETDAQTDHRGHSPAVTANLHMLETSPEVPLRFRCLPSSPEVTLADISGRELGHKRIVDGQGNAWSFEHASNDSSTPLRTPSSTSSTSTVTSFVTPRRSTSTTLHGSDVLYPTPLRTVTPSASGQRLRNGWVDIHVPAIDVPTSEASEFLPYSLNHTYDNLEEIRAFMRKRGLRLSSFLNTLPNTSRLSSRPRRADDAFWTRINGGIVSTSPGLCH